jgi:hypothetical protein
MEIATSLRLPSSARPVALRRAVTVVRRERLLRTGWPASACFCCTS